MKLDLGAGSRPRQGFISVDLNPAVRPDLVASALHLPFASHTVDEISAVDVAEHVPYRLTDQLFHEWARVLRTDGVLFVQVPAMDEIFRRYVHEPHLPTVPADLPQTPISGACWRIYGGGADGVYVDRDGDPRFNSHYAGFDRGSLLSTLARADFVADRIEMNGHPNYLCWAHSR